MTGSENTGSREKQTDHQQFNEQHDDHCNEAAAKVEKNVFAGHVDADAQHQADQNDAQRGNAHVHLFGKPIHPPALSFAVTAGSCILCASMPPVAVFFGLVLIIIGLLATVLVCDKTIGTRWMVVLGTISQGRFIAILAAVTLYPPLTLKQAGFFMRHPLAMLTDNAPPGLGVAFAFAMLCAAQTAIAMLLTLETMPPQRVTAFLLGIASVLPSGMGRRLRHRLIRSKRRFNSSP